MKILLVATELEPFAKSGGLADVTNYLPKEWEKQGHEVIVIMPKYGFIDTSKLSLVNTQKVLVVPMGLVNEYAGLWRGKIPNSNVTVYFVEHNFYFDRHGIYGDPFEFGDNDRRFIFLTNSIFEIAKELDFQPDVIHAHDFHTAFAMAKLKAHYRQTDFFSKTVGVFTIHNLAYQGKFSPYNALDASGFGMKEFYAGSWFENEGVLNFMKVGMMFADKITTVSPTYSQEIRLPYYSEGLHNVINERAADLIGVLNGVYYEDWNPENDNSIFENYTLDKLDLKEENKKQILNKYGFDYNLHSYKPLVGMVTRLTEQKGIDIIKSKLELHLENDKVDFIILGGGEQTYVEYFNFLQYKYPNNVITHIGYDSALAKRIYAACDYFLIPSRYEPCGLTQMYSLRYGTIPIVRATGGLADTVFEYSATNQNGNGFVFLHYSADDFDDAFQRALSYFNQKEELSKIKRNAMQCDYSSSKSASQYIQVFQWAKEKV